VRNGFKHMRMSPAEKIFQLCLGQIKEIFLFCFKNIFSASISILLV